MMTISDVIDNYGYLMSKKQLESLESIHPAKSAVYMNPAVQNDGSFYDPTKSHKWNTNSPSLGYRQFMSNWNKFPGGGGDIVSQILGEGEDLASYGNTDLLRVSTIYWKTQRKT